MPTEALTISSIDPLLGRQLRMLGVDIDILPRDDKTWQLVLGWISEHYRQMAEERRLLRKNMDLELHEICRRLADARQRVEEYMATAERAEQELRGVGALQRLWMPAATEVRRGRVELAGYCRAAGHCGGDFWAVYEPEHGQILLLMGDATGHSADSAMLTAVAKGATDLLVRRLPRPLTLSALLYGLNQAIHDATGGALLMTCTAALVDARRGSMVVVSAGHPLPIVVDDGPAGREINQIVASGAPLGAAADSRYREVEYQLQEGAAVCWYTDGVVEMEDRSGKQFGPRRLRKLLETTPIDRPTALCDTLRRALHRFADGAPPTDDVAFAFLRYGS